MKRAIEEYFPIIDINRLAVPERNAFKPIYQMHKWFARRSSSVFRAILLGALKPAGTDIMEEFYKDHTNDPDTKGKVILDPFMGGGTTVVEALRLGCKVIGVDLNPVAWFIVKTEVEPVDIEELKKAFERLANRTVEWSGKSVKETLLSLYKTECPACGNKDADIIYTFWVKMAPCTTATCTDQTPLFSDYIIAQKNPSIRYIRDYHCKCGSKFDWEREPAALVGDPKLMVNSSTSSAGEGRSNTRWAFSDKTSVRCPWCDGEARLPERSKPKLERKKVPLSVLYCPHCEEVWQYRGELPEEVECPTCKKVYNPDDGNIPERGKFVCRGTCGGNKDTIIAAIRKLSADQLLPARPYGIEGYCQDCVMSNDKQKAADSQFKMFNARMGKKNGDNKTLLWKNTGKFFKRITPSDLQLYKEACEIWKRDKVHLPHPKSEIPLGEKTKSGLLAHHYRHWHQMFNERQLLALGTLMESIDQEENQTMKEMLLSAFHSLLNDSNMFTWYQKTRDKIEGVFTRHDYQPKMEPVENNVFGVRFGKNTWIAREKIALCGKEYNEEPYDRVLDEDGRLVDFSSKEKVLPNGSAFYAENASCIAVDGAADLVITDPPYGGNVNYAELSDFFYVWLRLILRKTYPWFEPEFTPKAEEVIENRTRGKTALDFKDGLRSVFGQSRSLLSDEGLLVFTFHHSEGSTWEFLLEATCESGFYIESVYPIHGEAENSPHLIDKDAVSYDLVHICRKSIKRASNEKRAWASVRNEIRRQAREEVHLIEAGRYGRQLTAPDRNILLIGKCLELYSKHYGTIVDHEDKPVPIHRALEEIKMLVDQIITKEYPLPSELADIDIPSYIYFTTLYKQREIKADDVSKTTRGIIETGELRASGLLIKGREKRGRTFEVKQPLERLEDLKRKFHLEWPTEQLTLFGNEGQPVMPKDFLFVDCVHLLLGLAESSEDVLPWLERFRGLRPQLRAALEYLAQRNQAFERSAKTVLGLIDERVMFATQPKN